MACSRRASLPNASHAHRTGGSPSRAIPSSRNRRVRASIVTAITCPTSTGSTLVSTSAATTSGRSRPCATTAAWSAARSIALLRANGDCRARPSRSVSVTMPTTVPVPSVTGRWWIPRSSIPRSTSPTRVSADTVTIGLVTISATVASELRPAARTRERRSRSVTIPQSSPTLMRSEDTRCSVIRDATSATVASGGAVTGGRRTCAPTVASMSGISVGVRLGSKRRRATDARNRVPPALWSSSSARLRGIK